MARKLSNTLAKVTEELELNGSRLITSEQLKEICKNKEINYPIENLVYKLKKEGWFMTTGVTGVWEYIPAAVAGSYSSNDPLMPLKAFKLRYPKIEFYLCLQTAAWAQGYSDRIPSTLQICAEKTVRKNLPKNIKFYKYTPHNNTIVVKGSINCLAPESIIIQISSKPSIINSWTSSIDWIEELAYEIEYDKILSELSTQNKSTWARCGYFLSGLRPDISKKIYEKKKPVSKVRFGPRQPSIRNNEKWKIADTILPYNPEDLNEAK